MLQQIQESVVTYKNNFIQIQVHNNTFLNDTLRKSE